jgi:hypothetical protein
MSDKFITRYFWAALSKIEYEEKHFLGKETKQKEAQNFVDLNDYSNQLMKIYEELDGLNYDVVNVLPITSGQSEVQLNNAGSVFCFQDYSITRGAIVIGKKRD